MELNIEFKSRPPQPIYNLVKGILWLVKNWPEREQYLMLGNLYELGTPEIINLYNKEIIEKEEEETIWIEEDPFTSKLLTQLGKESGSGSKGRL